VADRRDGCAAIPAGGPAEPTMMLNGGLSTKAPAVRRYPPFQQQRKVLVAKHCDFQEQILSNGAMGDSYKLSK